MKFFNLATILFKQEYTKSKTEGKTVTRVTVDKSHVLFYYIYIKKSNWVFQGKRLVL